jgi:hypothetical protein
VVIEIHRQEVSLCPIIIYSSLFVFHGGHSLSVNSSLSNFPIAPNLSVLQVREFPYQISLLLLISLFYRVKFDILDP